MVKANDKNSERFKIILTVLVVYAACFFFRCLEYFLSRTDQTFWGEAFLHKLLGIAVCFMAFFFLRIKPAEGGFRTRRAPDHFLYGALLGMSVYVLAYGVESAILVATGKSPSLRLFVTGYSLGGNVGRQTGFLFFVLCFAGNVINVVMEEGVFRGLFLKLTEGKYTFSLSVMISSVLFGVWHLVAPLRSYSDGESSLSGMLLMMLTMFVSSGLIGVKFCLMTKMTGSLWFSMTDHFINNTSVNVLHVASLSGIDELQTVRIAIAQAISFIVVLIVFIKGKYYKKANAVRLSNLMRA